jgi:hypothetical protein
MLTRKKKLVQSCLIAILVLFALIIAPNAVKAMATSNSSGNTLEKALPLQVAQASGSEDINAIARATTVFINENLEKKEDLQSTAYGGSGVIVAVREDTSRIKLADEREDVIKNYVHSVLTNAHVVETKAGNPDQPYGLRLSNGEIRTIISHKFLGKITDTGVEGLDLALVEFMDDVAHPVATIAQSGSIGRDESILVSGWLKPESDSTPRKRLSSAGRVKDIKPPEPRGGMSLVYDAEQVGVGMSGGPVFNAKGELVAIHSAQVQAGDPTQGQAIQLQEALQELQRQGGSYNFKIAPPSISSSWIANLVKSLTPSADILTSNEFGLGFIEEEVTPGDSIYESVRSLKERYKCLKPFNDGSLRLKVDTTRGQFITDLHNCIASFEENVIRASATNLVTHKEVDASLNSLKQSIEALEQEIRSLQTSSNLNPAIKVASAP